MTPAELRALLGRGRGGDEVAFERLVEATRDRLFRRARRLLGSETLAEEVLQEAYVALWRAAGPIPDSPEAWLNTAVVNGTLDLLRREAHRRAVPWEEAGEPQEVGPDPLSLAQAVQVSAALEALLDRLPPGEREVFVLRAYEGWSFDEIAVRAGGAASTARNQFRSARRRLAVWLSQRGVSP